ncbi:MAG TPA: methyltransferase domain-containing protein [Gemmatimonadales bacterium]|nr:methyltransferase domain-containing protein [Gemmatimonadales bacterium]
MTCSCSQVTTAAARHFDERRIRKELESYQSTGPGPTTRGLLTQILSQGPMPETVLDVGSGIGPMSLELLEAGVKRAICVDMSPAALAANAEEARRRGVDDRVEQVEADFVAIAPTLPVVDLVVLDRVVCCYPAYAPLLEQATARSRRLLALAYPRDRWWVRLAMRIENAWRGIRGDDFRSFVHRPAAMAEVLRRGGFTRSGALATIAWQMELYARNG